MAGSKIRLIEASEDVAALVDQGADVGVELKNLGYQDKAIKAKLVEKTSGEINVDESPSVKVAGNKSIATVTAKTALKINSTAEAFPKVEAAISKGLLDGVVNVSKSIAVPPDAVDKTVALLEAAGIGVSVQTKMGVVPELKRPVAASVEEKQARADLAGAVESDVTYTVKYEARK